MEQSLNEELAEREAEIQQEAEEDALRRVRRSMPGAGNGVGESGDGSRRAAHGVESSTDHAHHQGRGQDPASGRQAASLARIS